MPVEHQTMLFDFEVTIETPLIPSSIGTKGGGGLPISSESRLREAIRQRGDALLLLEKVMKAYSNATSSLSENKQSNTKTQHDIEKATQLQSEADTRLKAAAGYQVEALISLLEKDAVEAEERLRQAVRLQQEAISYLKDEAELQKKIIQSLQKDFPDVEVILDRASRLHQEALSRLEEEAHLLEVAKMSISSPDLSQIIFELNTKAAPEIIEGIQYEIKRIYPR